MRLKHGTNGEGAGPACFEIVQNEPNAGVEREFCKNSRNEPHDAMRHPHR